MLTVYNCVANSHDLRLVALAAVICLLASFTAFTLLHHVRKSIGRMRHIWLAVSAIATGFGIWATHFIGMLAFSPGLPSGYNITLTILSLIGAILVTGIGLAVALSGTASLGGMIVGGGIALMHYTGMAAFEIEGRIVWEPALVAASVALGGALGAVALEVGLRANAMKSRIYGALLLTAAICSHHFTAMSAVSIIPDPTISVSSSALPTYWLAVAVAFASIMIFVLALMGLVLDIRDQRRAKLEGDRMRGLADAAVEGLIVCSNNVIATANNSFIALAGAGEEDVVGANLDTYFPAQAIDAELLARCNHPMEAELRCRDGSVIPVELILRVIDFVGEPHHAIAVRDLRSRKQAEQNIRFLAYHDALTGLPNRRSFFCRLDQEIEAARDGGQRVGLLCLDLDHFKEVNDLFGHTAGDMLLQTVVKTVTDILDTNQMMARLGGDEFAIILPAISDPSACARVAENILEALRVENEKSTSIAIMSTSIGVAICPDDAADSKLLLSYADTAMYCAKTEERGAYRFFEATMGAKLHDRLLLEQDLRQAISRGELRLVYQPQINIETDETIGFEALLRWKHATRGEISPAVFIPIAEETGMILQIGEWVLRTACHEAARWTRPLTIAVNVSAMQLHNVNFAHQVHEILFQVGIPPHRLELEITETALIRDIKRALATLRQLKSLGIQIAMDDFGTGYSSLSNLRAFPFDKIKIDTSFIKSVDTNEQAAAIVRAILGLGRGLGLPVLAEGVETLDELKFLSSELCNAAQGYLIGRPASIEQFRHLTNGNGALDGEAQAQSTTFLSEERMRVVGE
jgi:diguanylate cyclase (GGDEF)-like protein/PAS domain S-box-containing protein